MNGSEQLQELARQVRTGTLQILEAAEPQWLFWTPPGTSNHILWHAGHALWVQDVLCVEPLTARSELPDGWPEIFGMGCIPPSLTNRWPSRTEIRRLLEAQLRRMLELFEKTADDRLAEPGRWSVAGQIIHGLHDEAKHSGEMYLLLKMCRCAAQGSPIAAESQ